MNENQPPLEIHPDEHLEARITAYVLGEASPFEAAEIEALIEKSPELKLFANRTRTLNNLLKEAETTSSSTDSNWKLSADRRATLEPVLGPVPVLVPHRENRIRRASFRAAIGIAAIFLVTLFTKRFFILPGEMVHESPTITNYSAAENAENKRARVEALRRAVREQEDKVEEARKILTTISRTKNLINYSDGTLSGQNGLDEDSSAKFALNQYNELESEKTQLESQIKSLLKYDDEQLMIYSSGLDLPGNIVKSLYPQKLELQRQIEGLKASGLADTHPTIKSNEKVLNAMEAQLDEGVTNLRTRLQGQLDMTKERLAKIEVKKDNTKQDALERSIDAQDYVDAKRDFETDQALLDQMKLKLMSAEIDDSISESSIVIHEMPSETDPAIPSYAAEKTKQAAPSSPRASAIASNTPSPTQVPVPDLDLAPTEPAVIFGDGDDFGTGWGGEKSATAERQSKINIGGQVSKPGAQDFKEGLTLQEAVVRAGGATEFGSKKRVRLFRDGETQTYDISDDEIAQIELQPGDSIEMPQKNWFGCGASRDETIASKQNAKPAATPAPANRTAFEMAGTDRAENSFSRASAGGFAGNEIIDGLSKDENLRLEDPGADADPFTAEEKLSELAAEPAPRSDIRGIQIEELAELSAPADAAAKVSTWGFDATENEFKTDQQPGDEMPILDETPLLGRLFSEKKGKKNTERGIEVEREFTYPTEYEPEAEKQEPAADPFFDTSGILSETTNTANGVEYELNSGYQSQYLFRGIDLNKKPAPIDLTDLSQEIPATQEPFSTFSLNISDASFQVASSAVAKGERPDPESIKPEQFYNAVSYDDPAPSTGEPVAAAIGQVAHPIIPGRNLVRMSVRTASTGRAATQPLVLTLLVDQSGSMARADRRAAMDTALTQLATLMHPDDRITVIGFSRTPSLLADSLPGNDAEKLPDIINQASSEGGTNIEQALNLAEDLALRHKVDGAQNRIVLFTDGAANLGNADPDRLAERVKNLRQQDLAFDIAGIGTDDINDRLLSELSRHGNGRYYLVGENTATSLAKQLAGAFRPAAENVKIQVKFNPQRVGKYKLIGFEKDRLKTEDFRNDSVDAAELAADESGTALYQVEPLHEGSGEIGELFVRFRDTATGEMVERSWTIPYESQAPAIDNAQPQMQLATLSLLAAQKLQTGPLADAINFRDLAPTISAVKQAYARSPQAQQMITLINALK